MAEARQAIEKDRFEEFRLEKQRLWAKWVSEENQDNESPNA